MRIALIGAGGVGLGVSSAILKAGQSLDLLAGHFSKQRCLSRLTPTRDGNTYSMTASATTSQYYPTPIWNQRKKDLESSAS
jgi:hypothetical protein